MTRELHFALDLDKSFIISVPDDDVEPYGSPRRKKVNQNKPATEGLESFRVMGHTTYIRPDAIYLIEKLFKTFETVSIWSAGTKEYVEAIAQEFERRTKHKFYLIWHREHCPLNDGGEHVKPIERLINSPEGKKAGMTIENTILVDDLDLNVDLNPSNTCQVEPFEEPNPNDIGLARIMGIIFGNL